MSAVVPSAPVTASPPGRAARWFAVEPGERGVLLLSFACALCLFAGYAVLRPIRDTMGVTSGVSSLPALFWSVFLLLLIVQPIYGRFVSGARRAEMLPRIYAFLALMIMVFYGWFLLQDDHTWIARAYFVWVSVFNLFIVSVFWSLMADVFRREQAARLFGIIAAGISSGGLIGPALAGLLARPLGTINLLPVSAALLLAAAYFMRRIVREHRRAAEPAIEVRKMAPPRESAWDAFRQVARSPYLIGIGAFVLLLTAANTVIYVEQQRLVGLHVADGDARTQLFALLDFTVQAGALVGQMFLFSRMQRHAGFTTTLATVPALMVFGFAALAIAPQLAVVIAATLLRRIGEFALVRPSRDMLFTAVTPAEKYKAKNLLDTFVYRGGDAIWASALAGVTALVPLAGAAGWFGMLLALLWLAVAGWLGRRFEATRPRGDASPL